MKLFKNKKGVTLAELLAVITIMGIIAAIAVPAIGSAIQTSREGAAKSDAIAVYEAARVMCSIDTTKCSTDATLNQSDTTLQTYIDGISANYEVDIVSGKPDEARVTISVGSYTQATYDGTTASLS